MIRLLRRLSTPAAVLVLPVAVIGVIARSASDQISSSHAPVEYIDAPTSWIPFDADVTITSPSSAPVVGRFYRASDGSRRLETGPASGSIVVISITNVPDQTQYLFSSAGSGTWKRDFDASLAFGGVPPMWRSGPNWSLHPYKLAIRSGESGSVSADEGFEAYRVVSAQGVATLKVPELNFFDAVIMRPDGRYEAYANIVVREQDASLFRPPTDATMVIGDR